MCCRVGGLEAGREGGRGESSCCAEEEDGERRSPNLNRAELIKAQRGSAAIRRGEGGGVGLVSALRTMMMVVVAEGGGGEGGGGIFVLER